MREDNLSFDQFGTGVLAVDFHPSQKILRLKRRLCFLVAKPDICGCMCQVQQGGSPFDNFGPNLEPNIGKMQTTVISSRMSC